MNTLFLTAAEGTAGLSEWLAALGALNMKSLLAAVLIFLVGFGVLVLLLLPLFLIVLILLRSVVPS